MLIGKRSQVSAPIELVLAIIIMAGSLALAMFVINSSQQTQCVQEIKGEMEKIQSAFQDLSIAFSGTTRQVPVSLSRCRGSIEGVRFAYYAGAQYCFQCPGQPTGCWKIEPLVRTDLGGGKTTVIPLRDSTVCIDMPAKTTITKGSSTTCTALDTNRCPNVDNTDGTCGAPPDSALDNPINYQFITLTTGVNARYIMQLTKGVSGGGGSGQPTLSKIEVCAADVTKATPIPGICAICSSTADCTGGQTCTTDPTNPAKKCCVGGTATIIGTPRPSLPGGCLPSNPLYPNC